MRHRLRGLEIRSSDSDMAVVVGSVSGIVSTSDATKIIGLDKPGRMAIKLLTLYNPHSSAAPFLLRKRVLDENDEERFIRRFDASIPSTDSWVFGTLGGIIVLDNVEHWYELVMDSAPTQPIEYCIDFGVTT